MTTPTVEQQKATKRLRTTYEVVVTNSGEESDEGAMKFRHDICGICGAYDHVMSQTFDVETSGDHNGHCLDCITDAFNRATKSVYDQ